MNEPRRKEELPLNNLEKQLDPAALQASLQYRDALYEELLAKAQAISRASRITADEVHCAYWQIVYPNKEMRPFADSQVYISQALEENRGAERIAFSMAMALFLVGLVAIGMGIAQGDAAVRLANFFGGTIVELLVLVPFRFVVNSRRHNISIRMLGILLEGVDDPKKVAAMLKQMFPAIVLDKEDFKKAE
jgi:hypothetical protein